MVRILLINDTSGTTNPGCKLAVEGIRRAYRERFASVEIRSLPVGYWAEAFRPLASEPKDCIRRDDAGFPVVVPSARAVDVDAWLALAARQAESDAALADLLAWAELVVVNGEGSIHHNLPRALALLAVVHVAQASAKPVHVVNSTLYAMDERVLGIALGGSDFVHVREPGSARVLAALGIPHALAPDLACLALPPEGEGAPPPEPSPRECLVTAGVCAQEGYLERLFAAVRAAGLDPVYLSVGDGGERALTERVCARLAVPLAHADAFTLPDLARWLAARPIAVSGRHHLNLLLLAAGVPFVPLPSNTCKIEGTLELLQYPLAPAWSAEELERALAAAREAREARAADARRSAELARRAVATLVGRIPARVRA